MVLLVVAAGLMGCRDHVSPSGARLGDQHLLAGRAEADGGPSLSTVDLRRGWYASDDAALLPLRDYVRANLRLRGDLLSTVSVSGAAGPGYAVSVPQYLADARALCSAGLRSLSSGCSTADLGTLSLLDAINLELRHDDIAVRWVDVSGPQILMTLPVDVDLDPPDWLPSDPESGTLEIDVLVDLIDFGEDPGPIAFRDYYRPGAAMRRRAGVSVRLREVRVIGFNSTIVGVDLHATIQSRAAPIVADVVDLYDALLDLNWFEQIVAGEAVEAWCGLTHPAGCPVSGELLETLERTSSIRRNLGDVLQVSPTIAAPRTPPFDDRTVEALRRGAWIPSYDLTTDGDRAQWLCSRGFEGECAVVELCAAPPTAPFAALCSGRTLHVRVTQETSPLSFPALPVVAQFADTAPGLAEQLVRIYLGPVDAYNRAHGHLVELEMSMMCPANPLCPAGARGATYVFPVDDDGDGIPFVDDNCPDVATPDLTDTDGDGRGDACDDCPLVPGWGGGDRDGDRVPDLCDCDIDGDTCTNAIVDHAGGALCAPSGKIFDQLPRLANPRDASDRDRDGDVDEPSDVDGDGYIDDCDSDDDGDGVPDGDDNCRWVANPDQTNSGGSAAGDACDSLCPGPGASGCSNPFGIPALDWFDGLLLRRVLPALTEPPLCLVDGPGCWLLVTSDPIDPAAVILQSDFEAPGATVAAWDLRFGAKVLGARAAVDLDRDGRTELLLTLPETGEVVAYDPVKAQVVARAAPLGADGEKAGVGAAVIVVDGSIFVGAPDYASGQGAVIELAATLELATIAITPGATPGERFGADLAPGPGAGVLVVAEAATTESGIAAGRVDWIVGKEILASFDGAAPGAADGLRARSLADGTVLIAAPAAKLGAGVVRRVELDGAVRWETVGAPGDHLGASLQPLDDDGAQVLVGATGGAGRFYTLDAAGQRNLAVVGGAGQRVGAWATILDRAPRGRDLVLGERPTLVIEAP